MRGLTGAVINNLYLVKNNRLFMLFILALPILITAYFVTGTSRFLQLAEVLVVVGIPVGLLESSIASFDSRWNVFENSWSVSPNTVVLSRYVLFLMVSLLCTALWVVSPLGGRYQLETAMGNMGIEIQVVMCQLMCILFFPVISALNPRQTAVGIIAFIVAAVGAATLSRFILLATDGNVWFLAAILVLAHVISASISIIFNNFHRGRTA
jgi:hypothetical protein